MPRSLSNSLLALGAAIHSENGKWGEPASIVYDEQGQPAGYWDEKFFEDETNGVR